MAQLARYFLPPSKVTGAENGQVKNSPSTKARSRSRGQSNAVKYAGHNLRLVRIYLPFTSTSSSKQTQLPNSRAPYVQFALCPGDTASLYRLKQDVFTALATGLTMLGQRAASSNQSNLSSNRPSFFDDDQTGSDQRSTSAAADRAASMSNGNFSTPPRGAAGRRRKSFDQGTVCANAVSPPPLSLGGDALSRTMSEGSITQNLRSASVGDRSEIIAALTTAANSCRRLPLPPRHRIRPRNSQISPIKASKSIQELKQDDNGEVDEEELFERAAEYAESITNASMKEELSDFSEELRDLIGLLRSGSGGATPTQLNSSIPSPTPFRFGASYIWWGPSGAGAAIAAEMMRKGVDAFAWRAVESPPSLGLEDSLCQGWLLRKSSGIEPPSPTSGKGDSNVKWKKRYFNIIRAPNSNSTDKWLFAYFKDASMSKVLNAIQMSHVSVVRLKDPSAPALGPCDVVLEMTTPSFAASPNLPVNHNHLLRTANMTEAVAWVAALEKARTLSNSTPSSPSSSSSSSSSSFDQFESSTPWDDAKFFEDEMVNLLEVVEEAPRACSRLPAMKQGYYDDFSDDMEKQHILGNEEDEEEDDDDGEDDDDEDNGWGNVGHSAIEVLNSRQSVVLELTYANLLPPPTLKARVTGSRNVTDAYSKEYTQYEIRARQGQLQWTVYRRFREFKVLHSALKKKESGIDTTVMPKLPPKQVSGSLKDDTINLRADALNNYVCSLLLQENSLSNVHVLSFLGLMNLNRFDETASGVDGTNHPTSLPSSSPKDGDESGRVSGSDDDETFEVIDIYGAQEEQNLLNNIPPPPPPETVSPIVSPNATTTTRPVMHISTLRAHAGPGDLILFRCANSMSGLQRSVTGAEWDHVALIVPSAYSSTTLNMLESTGEGCTVYPLQSRLKAYAHGFITYMVIRRLVGPKSEDNYEKLRNFSFQVDGKPYGFSMGKLFQRKELSNSLSSSTHQSSSTNGNTDGGQTGENDISRTFSRGAWSEEQCGAQLSQEKKSSSWRSKLMTLTPKQLNLEKKKTFFCSELVAAAQQEAGFIRPNFNVSAFWPGSFAMGGEVDEAVGLGFEYGPEIIIDCREVEVGKALEVSPKHRR